MEKSTPGLFATWIQTTSKHTPNAISSLGSEGGHMHCASPDGQTTGRSGREAARASRSASQAKVPVQTIPGTCGRTSIASSPPSGPLSSWESKLRERLAMVGSTECALIWRKKITPAGASISRLARWTPPHIRQRLYWVATDLADTGLFGSTREEQYAERRFQFGEGFWDDHIWLTGADGKSRRSKPSLPLLAHGIPGRVGRLRAYGNAIVPQVAAEVIKAFMECEP